MEQRKKCNFYHALCIVVVSNFVVLRFARSCVAIAMFGTQFWEVGGNTGIPDSFPLSLPRMSSGTRYRYGMSTAVRLQYAGASYPLTVRHSVAIG